MARMLASVQKVVALSPIEGADRIEVATILGWQCVVRKDAFKVGDLGVYFEIDSILPPKPEFEFLKDKKYRIRTIKLKKTISQGLFMSFGELGIKPYSEGRDLTALLEVQKWEPPEDAPIYTSNKKKSLWMKLVYTLPFLAMFRKKVGEGTAFPTRLIPKSDETRLQAFGDEFLEKYWDLFISVSQKMDGSSCTFIWNKRKFSVASRNVWFIEKKDNNFWRMAIESNIAEAMKKSFGSRNICLQGELCGPAIQGNKYKLPALTFFLFNAFDSDKREYFNPYELEVLYEMLIMNGAKISLVDSIIHPTEMKTIKDVGLTVDEWMKFATTKSRFNPETYNEGIVVRSLDNKPFGVRGMEGGRFSFKVVSSEYLLQHNL